MTVVCTTVVCGCCEVVCADEPPDAWPPSLVVPLVVWFVVDDGGCAVVDDGG